MPSSQPSNDILNNEGNIEINESHNVLFKLYATLLTNSAFQNGVKQLTRFSQPIIGKFDDNLVKLTSNVSRWVSHDNIFNQLVNVWLSQNFPVTEDVVSFEAFLKEFNVHFRSIRRVDRQTALKNFYELGAEAWKSLDQPSLDVVKNTILEFVARVVNKTYSFPDESLSNALYNMLKLLVEKRKELVSGESFLNLIRTSLGEEFYNSYSKSIKLATNEYYVFAKRFLLIDFPLATNNKDVLRLILNYIQDNTFYYGDSTLNFVDKRLNTLLKALGQPNEDGVEDHNLTEKAQRLLRKVYTLSTVPFKRMETVIHQVQSTKTYNTIDNYLHINNKIDDTFHATIKGYNLLKDNILVPGANAVRVVSDKAKSKVTIIVHGLEVNTLKERYTQLYAKYEVLQKCVVIVKDETVNFVFDRQAIAKTGEEVRKQINKLYHELKGLKTQNVRNMTVEYYNTILRRAQTTYNTARKAVYDQKVEQNDKVAADAVRPSGEKESDNVVVVERREVKNRRETDSHQESVAQPDSNAEEPSAEPTTI